MQVCNIFLKTLYYLEIERTGNFQENRPHRGLLTIKHDNGQMLPYQA